jgi:hypothetical protein
MAAKLTRLTHIIEIQLQLVAESCTICSSHSRRPVRKLLDITSRARARVCIYKRVFVCVCVCVCMYYVCTYEYVCMFYITYLRDFLYDVSLVRQ